MVDKFYQPLLTPQETAKHLRIPRATIYSWLREKADTDPLVHHVEPERKGQPSVPFVAVVEAYVLRSLRDLRLSKRAIRSASTAVRAEFGTPYALATKRICTDGIDIFIEYDDGDLARAGDGQRAFREILDDYLRYITWDKSDGFAGRLQLRQYPEIAPVVIDPRFGWGAPVVEINKVPVSAVVDFFLAGESIDAVAYEYDMTRDQVEAICRAYVAA